MQRIDPADMPPVTEEHRRRAHAALRLATSYEEALQNDTHRRVIEARAAQLRKHEWQTRNTHIKPKT